MQITDYVGRKNDVMELELFSEGNNQIDVFGKIESHYLEYETYISLT